MKVKPTNFTFFVTFKANFTLIKYEISKNQY